MDAYGNVNSENSIFLFNLPGVVVQSREGPMRADGRSILTIL